MTTVRPRYRNLMVDPHTAISIVDPTDPLRYLEIRGAVECTEADPDYAFIDRLTLKYFGSAKYPYHSPGDVRMVIIIRPVKVYGVG